MSTSLEVQSTNSTSLSSSETASDDFVLVSPSASLQQFSSNGSKPQSSYGEGSSKKFASESHKEDEVMQNVVELGKENDRLREALVNNNDILQKYIKDFSEMQETHKANNEHVKREHQRAKEVVKKLRDDNRALKDELKKANQQLVHTVKQDLERENAFMKAQINSFQQHVGNLDEYMKECEIPETVSENWQQLLGSLVSYKYQAGIPQINEQSLAKEMAMSEGECSAVKPRENYDQKYMELETENKTLKVDNEKINIEKQNLERHLKELTQECSKMKRTIEQMNEEKDEMKKMFDEQCENTSKEQKQHHEMAVLCQTLQEAVQNLSDELKTTKDKLRNAEEKENLMKIQQCELEQQLKNQSSTELQDDDDIHGLCREKYKTMQELYFKLEKKMNNMEERENSLCAKERAFENEKSQAETKVEEMRTRYVAEVESHSKSFIEKTNELHSELQEAREREESLQEQLEQVQVECSEKEESLREQVCQLIKENDSMRIKIEKLTELNSRRDTLYEERMKTIENKKKEKELENAGIIDMLKSQLGAAKEERKKFQDQSQMFKVEHDRLAYQHEQMTKEYDELLNSYKSMLQENRLRSHHSAEIEEYRDKVDDYASHLAASREEIQKKGSIILDLENRLRLMEEQQTEEVPVLRQQMDVYFNDFKAEREARERQQTDLLNLREENQKLAEANRELQQELENQQNHHQMAEMQRRHLSHSGQFNPEDFRAGYQSRRGVEPIYDVPPARQHQERNEPRPQEPQHELEEAINCPGCGREFWSFAEGANHVAQCQAVIQRNQPQINENQCPLCGNEYPDPDTLEIHVQECLENEQ